MGSILEVTLDLYYKIQISYTIRVNYKIRISIEALELLKKEYWHSYYPVVNRFRDGHRDLRRSYTIHIALIELWSSLLARRIMTG